MIDCGACPHGSCATEVVFPAGPGGHCWNIGAACSTAADCAAGERCLFARSSQSRRCAKNVEGQQCLAMSGDADCTFLTQPVDAYHCRVTAGAFGTCAPWCLETAECAAGQSCHPYIGAITASTPGVCY
jgi:hypothetical protein